MGIWQMHDTWELPEAHAKVGCNSIPGTKDGPYPEAREFLLRKRALLSELWEPCRAILEQERTRWFPQRSGEPLHDCFVLTSLGLDEPITDPPNWSVGFESLGSRWIYVEIEFKGDEVVGHVCDD